MLMCCKGCDDVLQSVETYLSSFQTDLAAVSAEIETLQSRSTGLSKKLDNRRKVEKLLGPTVERLAIAPSAVKKISEGPIDESFIQSLEDLQRRSRALDTATDLKDVKAAQDLTPTLGDLANKVGLPVRNGCPTLIAQAVERIRDYFAAQIRALRSPNINAQIIQQQRFLRFQPLYAFLFSKQPQLGTEIMQAYANTMRWYYESHFVRYHASLAKLKLFITDRHDLLGEDATAAAKARGNTSAPRTDNFNLARRLDILTSPAATAMPSHAAEETRASHHIETPFLAYNLALVDNASLEYSFLSTFFSSRSALTSTSKSTIDHSVITRTFSVIFNPVIGIATSLVKNVISDTYDALGVLIMIRIMQHFAFVLQRRKVPTLEAYINGVNMLLWPRFQSILDANCASLKQLTNSLPNRQSGASNAAGTLLGGGGNGAVSAPHPVTQRFANFIRGVTDLSSEAEDDEPVSNSLSRLRGDYEGFLSKLGASFGSGEKAKKERNRFLTNNYTLILAVLGDAKGRLAQEMKARFEELKQAIS